MSDMEQQDAEILYEVRDGIGYVTFNRPAARNAFTFGMYEALANICIAAPGQGLKALVFTGAGTKPLLPGRISTSSAPSRRRRMRSIMSGGSMAC